MLLLSVFIFSCAVLISNASVLSSPPGMDGKIVGGDEIDISESPWSVALLLFVSSVYMHNCGGSLASTRTVITAAHCLDGIPALNYKVRIGSTYKNFGGELIDSSRHLIHEGFNRYNFQNDIGLLYLATPVREDTIAMPIPLPTQGQTILDGTMAEASGWGKIQESGVTSETLRRVEVPIVNQKTCMKLNQAVNRVTPDMLCAGYVKEGSKDACSGDSGGPLVADGLLVGVTSWGLGCARPNKPGVYTRVASYVNWIQINIDNTNEPSLLRQDEEPKSSQPIIEYLLRRLLK